jgi:hypothetical protein
VLLAQRQWVALARNRITQEDDMIPAKFLLPSICFFVRVCAFAETEVRLAAYNIKF